QIHFEVEQVGHRVVDLPLQLLVDLQQEVHSPIKLLQRDFLEARYGHLLTHPRLDLALAVGRQGAVGHHGEDGPFHRGAERPLLCQRFQKAVDADLLPERVQHPGAAQGARFDESQTALALQGGLSLQDILGAQKAGDASDQAPELLDVVFVGTVRRMVDARPGQTGHRIALVVCDLEVSDYGAVFVLAPDSSEVHVYIEPYFTLSDKHLLRIRVPTRYRDFASLRGE